MDLESIVYKSLSLEIKGFSTNKATQVTLSID